jgi:dihydrodipicolinate synthase/N-acetylneuraminate lyase
MAAYAIFVLLTSYQHPTMHPEWTGIYPAVTTTFHKDGSLDLVQFKKNIEVQIESGVDGIIVCGSLGENSTLSPAEKILLLVQTLEQSSGRVPVVICVAESSTVAAIEFVKLAADAGADGLMVLPPMRYPSDDRETMTYLKKVIAASSLPIMIYNNPVAYKTLITTDMFRELEQFPQVQSMKESTGDVRNLTDLRNDFGNRYKILTGVDDLALESLMMGADGWVAGLVCAFPRETVAIYRLAIQGRWQEASAIYRWFYPVLHLDVSNKLVQNIKLAQSLTGLGTEFVREPRLPLYGTEREKVLKILQDAMETRPKLPSGSFGSK